jgi:DNA-binding response OmpR family regulator
MKILMLSDDSDSAHALLEHLQQTGSEHSVTSSTWPDYAPSRLKSRLQEVDFILLNIHNFNFHDRAELNSLVRLRQRTRLPIFLIAPIEDEETIVQVYASGIDDHLVSPVSPALFAAKMRVWQRVVMRLTLHYN